MFKSEVIMSWNGIPIDVDKNYDVYFKNGTVLVECTFWCPKNYNNPVLHYSFPIADNKVELDDWLADEIINIFPSKETCD
jgi:hypothetical protein